MDSNIDPVIAASRLANLIMNAAMRLLTSLLLLTGIGAAALSLDGNDELNAGLKPDIFHSMGQYSPRYTVSAGPGRLPANAQPPLGCEVVLVDSLERHGARHFTAGAYERALASLGKVKVAIANVSDAQLQDSTLGFLRNYTISSDTDSLVPYGALQAYYSGRSTRQVYPGLSSEEAFVRASGDEALLDDRVILTAKYWTLGYSGAAFPSGTYSTSQQIRSAPGLKEPNVVLSEQDGFNNTLDVSTCTNAENLTPDPESAAQEAYGMSTIVPVVGQRLQNRLKPAMVNLTYSDVLNIMNLCSFETLGNAVVTDGQLSLKVSPVCNAFTASEWQIYGYALNAGKYAGAGYGNPYYKALGQGYLRELYARFNGSAPPLQDPTSLNSTIDGNPANFPLPSAKQNQVFFDGSHDNNIGPIAAAFGLFDGPALTTGVHAEEQPHNWDFSHIAPLGGKIVFEKIRCLSPHLSGRHALRRDIAVSKDFVRVRANGAVQDPSSAAWCSAGTRNSLDQVYLREGLCPLDTVLGGLAWVNQATEWNKCFA